MDVTAAPFQSGDIVERVEGRPDTNLWRVTKCEAVTTPGLRRGQDGGYWKVSLTLTHEERQTATAEIPPDLLRLRKRGPA